MQDNEKEFIINQELPAEEAATRGILPRLSEDPQDDVDWADAVDPLGEAAERRKDLRIVIVWAVLIMAVLLAVIVYLRMRKIRIPLDPYLSITTEGYDTIGTASCTFDRDAFIQDYRETIRYRGGKANTKVGDFANAAEALVDTCIEGELSRTEKLSNGDRITFVWDCDDDTAAEAYHCVLQYTNLEKTVDNLQEPEQFDPFAGISLSYTGLSRRGTATVDRISEEAIYQNIRYTVDPSSGLKNGDTVRVTASAAEGEDLAAFTLQAFGCIPVSVEKEYTVEGLAAFLSSFDDLTEETLQTLQIQADEIFQREEQASWNRDVSLLDRTYLGSYLLEPIGTEDGEGNLLYLVYQVRVQAGSQTVTYYTYTAFSDLQVQGDGRLAYDPEAYDIPSGSHLFGMTSGDIISVRSGWRTYYFSGFETVDALYSRCVYEQLDRYTYTSSLAE